MERREQELREKQEQLVQAGKLATLGELTTGVAHELNNPLNNIGLFVGNVLDQIRLGEFDAEAVERELENAMEQVRKATVIISHLRTFGRAARSASSRVGHRRGDRALAVLMQEQLRLRGIEVVLDLCADELVVFGNPIQLEQVFMNLLTNARDALEDARTQDDLDRDDARRGAASRIRFSDTGPGSAASSSSASSTPSSRRRRSAPGPAWAFRSRTASSRSTEARSPSSSGAAAARASGSSCRRCATRRRSRDRRRAHPDRRRRRGAARGAAGDASAAARRNAHRHLRQRRGGARSRGARRLRRRRDRHQDARHGRARRPAARSSSCGRRRRRS